MPIKVHGMAISGNVFPVLGLCAENGIEAELVPCNLMEGAHKTPEFLKMNPMHCIPTMDDDGFTMWESKAILRYICNKHSLEQWYPADYKKRGVCDLGLDFYFTWATDVFYKVLYPAAGFAGPVEPSVLEAAEKKFNEDLIPGLQNLIAREAGPLIGGAKPNIADLMFASNLYITILKCPDSYVAKSAVITSYVDAFKAACPKFAEWTGGDVSGFWTKA